MIARLLLLVIFFCGVSNQEYPPPFERIEGVYTNRLLIANVPSSTTVSTGFIAVNSEENGFQLAVNLRSQSNYRAVLHLCSRIELGNRRLAPAEAVHQYVGKIDRISRPEFEETIVTVFKQAKYGTVVTSADVDGRPRHHYVTADSSWLGKDRAEYEVTFRGKIYKVIERIELVQFTDQYDDERGNTGHCSGLIKQIGFNGLSSDVSDLNRGFRFSNLPGVFLVKVCSVGKTG
jgi:hypothetical protein